MLTRHKMLDTTHKCYLSDECMYAQCTFVPQLAVWLYICVCLKQQHVCRLMHTVLVAQLCPGPQQRLLDP